jgi:hypothetical protein
MATSSFRLVGLTLLMGLALGSTGCRTAGVGNLARPDPAPLRTGMNVPVLLADHNRNAESIQSLEAAPQIDVSESGRRRGASGKLAFERERNFNLHLSTAGIDVADIGSNDQEFWIWVNERRDPAVYYCNYDETGASPLSVSFQPDFIIQAIGLRVIPESEMKRMKAEKGLEPDTVVLTLVDKTPQGQSVIRETILKESTGRILEHRIYTSDHKTLLASATVTDFQDCKPPSDGTSETVYLPKSIRVEWTQEKLTMNVALKGVKINPKFDSKRAAALFAEPKQEGVDRRNLADHRMLGAPPAPGTSSNSTRETLPAPAPPPRRIQLGEPTAIPADSAMKTSTDSLSVADRTRIYAQGAEQVIGAPIPSAADPIPKYAQASSGLRNSLEAGIER